MWNSNGRTQGWALSGVANGSAIWLDNNGSAEARSQWKAALETHGHERFVEDLGADAVSAMLQPNI